MSKIPALLAAILFLCGCNPERKELEKLKVENGKLQNEIRRLENEVKRLKAANSESEYEDKYRRAMADIRAIGNALEAYIMDHTKLPRGNSLMELAYNPDFVPFYIKAVPYIDPWGKEYSYKTSLDGEHGTYWIACSGSDDVFNGYGQEGRPELQPGMDIVFVDGDFIFAAKF